MRKRTTRRTGSNGNGNGGGSSRTSKSVSNQLSFNVICLALAIGGDAHTEPCESNYID